MGDFCGFVARVKADAAGVATRIESDGGRDLQVYPELNMVLGIIKSYAPGDGAVKLSLIEEIDAFEVVEP